MSQVTAQAGQVQKKTESARQAEQKSARQDERWLAQVAYRRTQGNGGGLRPADLLALQRIVDNRQVQRMVARRIDRVNGLQQGFGANHSVVQRSPGEEAGGANDAEGEATAITTLLHSSDPVAGMRTSEAVHRLERMRWPHQLAVLRVIHNRSATDLPIIQENASLLTSVTTETVILESATSVEPEVLARYRARVLRLSSADRANIIAIYPSAAVPADPALPPGGLQPPAGSPAASLPGPLLETLYRTYARRQAGLPGSDRYLDNAFWSGRPADFWQALAQMGSALGVVRRIYDR